MSGDFPPPMPIQTPPGEQMAPAEKTRVDHAWEALTAAGIGGIATGMYVSLRKTNEHAEPSEAVTHASTAETPKPDFIQAHAVESSFMAGALVVGSAFVVGRTIINRLFKKA